MIAMKLKNRGQPINTFFCWIPQWLFFFFFISSPSKGPYSLNGYRVRVYRQDSATQWFTGIITHHDLFTRTMVVMNDQVSLTLWCLEKQALNKLCTGSFSNFWWYSRKHWTYHFHRGMSVISSAENSAWLCAGLAVNAILKLNVCAIIWLIPALQFGFSSVVAIRLAKSLK